MNQSCIMGILNGVEQLLVDGSNLVQVRQAMAQMAGQRPTFDEGHNKKENALRFAKLDQWQNVWMVEACNSTRLTSEAATHLRIGGIIPKDHLDSYAPIKSGTLFPLIDSPHASHTYASHHLIIAKLRAFQTQHPVRLSFLSSPLAVPLEYLEVLCRESLLAWSPLLRSR